MDSISNFLFEILQKYCNLFTLNTLRMLDHAHQEQWYHLVGNFDLQNVEINL